MQLLPLNDYDVVILTISGGKDSLATALHLMQLGVAREKMVVWHQCIDGHGTTTARKHKWDWESTPGYVAAFCKAFDLPLFWQWREGGFERELLKENQATGDVYYVPANSSAYVRYPTTKAGLGTRLKFPAKTASLLTRWCSAALKIDVARRCVNNYYTQKGIKILYISGERREESPARAKYQETELHHCHTQSRLVHHWRPIIDWTEKEVWGILERNKVQPHPVYYLGFPRVSCKRCIFFSPNHWATLAEVDAAAVEDMAYLEWQLGFTVDNKASIMEMVAKGTSLLAPEARPFAKRAIRHWEGSVITDNWVLPAGAYGKGGGSL